MIYTRVTIMGETWLAAWGAAGISALHPTANHAQEAEEQLNTFLITNYALMPKSVQMPGIVSPDEDTLQSQNVLLQAELTKLQAELENKTDQLITIEKELDDFARAVSHDLRAPIRAIKGFADILEEEYSNALDEEGKRFLNLILKNSEQMNRLIDALLKYSRLGRRPLRPESLAMNEIAQDALAQVQARYPAHHPKIKVDSLPGVTGDQAMIEQVFLILLDNAFKFTARTSRPRVMIGATREGREHVIFIQDNGAGFEMQYSGQLFTMFGRLHSQDEFEGAGTGLALVKRIITRHGGRTWAEGAVNQGATFYFSLPANE